MSILYIESLNNLKFFSFEVLEVENETGEFLALEYDDHLMDFKRLVRLTQKRGNSRVVPQAPVI